MTSMECCLFVFGKEVIRIAIEHHFADTLNGHQFFRDQFAGSRRSKSNLNSSSSGNQLEAQFVFRKIACFNGFPQLAAVEVRVTSGEFFVLHPKRVRLFYLPVVSVETYKRCLPFGINQAEGVNTEAFHGAVTAGGMPRSDIAHITLCRVSGCRET